MAKEKTPEELAALAGAIGKDEGNGTAEQDNPVSDPEADGENGGLERISESNGTEGNKDSGTATAAKNGGTSITDNGGCAGTIDPDELAAQMSYSEFAALEPEAMPMIAAAGAYQALIAVGQAVAAKLAGAELTCGPHPASTLMAREMAGFVRKIGRRATADVLAQHLKIRKLRDSAEISTPERIALTAYIQTLLDLDAFIAVEREAQAKAQEERQTPAPTPIEDTIFEPADDFFTQTY
ncbi:hypothetical protein FS764_16525 [Agrobacterium vitis]|uniref:hypothetical protein n=1 Tax=Agrobacterium vitis TaxID=373 RepID=UPI001F3A9725|nr:hypothetical protein [Agrobacterium vitis]MCF1468514.1 hypothetical protein [Agrobacterium vitis]